jgi:hypothetical protein
MVLFSIDEKARIPIFQNFLNFSHCYENVIDVNWGLVVKLALPGKVTKVCGIYDTFLTNV